jgi:hypothetical protein
MFSNNLKGIVFRQDVNSVIVLTFTLRRKEMRECRQSALFQPYIVYQTSFMSWLLTVLAGWMAGRLAGWLAGRLADWLAGWFIF